MLSCGRGCDAMRGTPLTREPLSWTRAAAGLLLAERPGLADLLWREGERVSAVQSVNDKDGE